MSQLSASDHLLVAPPPVHVCVSCGVYTSSTRVLSSTSSTRVSMLNEPFSVFANCDVSTTKSSACSPITPPFTLAMSQA